jgi:curli production assembly/transport component CsgG
MKEITGKIGILLFFVLFSGCGAYFNQPIGPQNARIAENTEQTERLLELPLPDKPIVVGVYNFKDQTGQYKNIETGSTFSTAVTQGATTILIKALQDSKWFTPIERENFANLLNERNIIRTTRQEYLKNDDDRNQRLSPLLFAGILLEGGIVSYDTNILTGGVGARYFGVGGSSEYRQDRITIYLRAVSTSTGEILKTVNVSKTILSQAVDVGIFRYVNFQRLLEAETGFTKNEPTQLAVQAAIEKAVEVLIYEGIKDQLWVTLDGPEKDKEVVDLYLKEKEEEANTNLYERAYQPHDYRHSAHASFGLALPDGDFNTEILDYNMELGYKYRFIHSLSLGLTTNFFRLNSTGEARYWWLSQAATIEYNILPNDKLSPFLYAGPGVLVFVDDSPSVYLQRMDTFFFLKFGAGLEYQVSDRISFIAKGDWDPTFSDKIDNEVRGRRDDYFFTFSAGINYHFGSKKSKLKTNR